MDSGEATENLHFSEAESTPGMGSLASSLSSTKEEGSCY